MIINPDPLRTCSRCTHWGRDHLAQNSTPYTANQKHAHLDGMCTQAPDERDHKWRRGGDHCGHWQRSDK